MSRDDTDRDRSACVTDVPEIACGSDSTSGPALNRTERALLLMEQGYSQGAAALAVGLPEASLRMARRRRGMGPLPGGKKKPPKPKPRPFHRIAAKKPKPEPAPEPMPKPTGRKVFRDVEPAPLPEPGTAGICTDDDCATVELHCVGEKCRTYRKRSA